MASCQLQSISECLHASINITFCLRKTSSAVCTNLIFFCVLCSSAFAIKRSNSHCEFNFPLGVVAWSKFCKRKLKSSESSISSGRNRQNFAINTRVCFNKHTEMHFVLYRFKQYDMSYQWFNTSSLSSSMCSSALLFLARRLKCSTLRNKLFIQ